MQPPASFLPWKNFLVTWYVRSHLQGTLLWYEIASVQWKNFPRSWILLLPEVRLSFYNTKGNVKHMNIMIEISEANITFKNLYSCFWLQIQLNGIVLQWIKLIGVEGWSQDLIWKATAFLFENNIKATEVQQALVLFGDYHKQPHFYWWRCAKIPSFWFTVW